MDLFQIEEHRRNLMRILESESSQNQKVLLINDFITQVVRTNDHILIRAYLPEFTGQLENLLNNYTPLYKTPDFTRQILNNLKLLIDSGIDNSEHLIIIFNRLRDELDNYQQILSGIARPAGTKKKIFFPAVELFQSIGDRKLFGFLEQIQVEVFESKDEDVFVVIPSEREIDKRLNDQIKTSWLAALEWVKRYVRKTGKHHRVIVQFDVRHGFYVGDSLGTALTVMYIQKLLAIYNSVYLIDVNDDLSITGGISAEGNIIPVSELIIRSKIEIVFFSPINTFIIPESDRASAEQALIQLQTAYPERNKLRIIGIKDLQDLFDRRSLISISKQNPLKRGAKVLRKNWIPAALLSLLLIVFSVFIFIDMDNNPVMIEHTGNTVRVLNHNGKILWSEKVIFDSEDVAGFSFNRIMDIDGDGQNEVFLSGIQSSSSPNEPHILFCYNLYHEVIWSYTFTDTVSTELEEHSQNYQIILIDTINVNDRTLFYLIARNNPFYPSAIFKIDAVTGVRIDSAEVFWHAGNIIQAMIGDFNGDGTNEITGTAITNCYESNAVFSIDISKLSGQAPAEGNYVFKNIPDAELNQYVIIPKSDYCTAQNIRLPVPANFNYDHNRQEFSFYSTEGKGAQLLYFLNKELKINKVNCGDKFEVMRDDLVDKGILNPPYTNTKEYFDLLKSKVLYWNGNSFVNL